MIIDCHTHISDFSDLEEYLEKNRHSFALTVPYPDFSKEYAAFYQNIDAMIAKNSNIAVIDGINVKIDIKKQLDEIKKNITKRRVVGLKIYLGYQPVFADNPKLKIVYQFAKANKLTIVYHCGVVADELKQGAHLKYSTNLNAIDDVAVKYPDVNFIISHFAFPKLWDTAAIVMKNDNCFTDISGLFEGDSDFSAHAKQIIHDLNAIQCYWPELARKVMFGTDFAGEDTTLKEINTYLKIVKTAFENEDYDDVTYNNALKAYPRLPEIIDQFKINKNH